MAKIKTPGLRDGDHLVVFGVTIKLEGKPLAVQAPGRNRTVFTWPNMPIVQGRISWAPDATSWSIQGGPERTWHVVRRGS